MNKILVLFLSFNTIFSGIDLMSQVNKQEETEQFILKVMSEYKNPMAYYPLRRDIFLPDEEEAEAIERKADYPEGATVSGSFIFLGEDDELDRPRFVDSQGKLMFGYSPYKGWSQKGSYQYQKRKFELISNGTPALGRFLYLYGKVED
ncbi:hypothetical protein [Roseivirga pacifica]|uniref:hypothetical protein n=1 Tax=Roseivirga pacifica TaxID=1267423 RepID=UPI00209472E6|nr:hypothetical protein [Roseivirga pacifica]MCO6359292.1 hypothetical protein [Roseivirga pacifica]MCO6366662.1 hypothetical protein [Roseivirga pacifica]MCO6370806.1 hypothetical protein [Roseivirga pacifica]MCO6374318.1 hypothetical protein [Roseivirga pacifica]MCO6379577.1 hypothetical protein [Roseivirga pacifica]